MPSPRSLRPAPILRLRRAARRTCSDTDLGTQISIPLEAAQVPVGDATGLRSPGYRIDVPLEQLVAGVCGHQLLPVGSELAILGDSSEVISVPGKGMRRATPYLRVRQALRHDDRELAGSAARIEHVARRAVLAEQVAREGRNISRNAAWTPRS